MRIALDIVRWLTVVFIVGMTWLGMGIPAIGMALAVRAMPPIDVPTLNANQIAAITSDGDRVQLGRCYKERIGALTHVHLEGPTAELGYYQGALVGSSIARIESEMLGVFTERVPSFWARHLILGLVSWNNRSLDSYFLPQELTEIAAITEGHRQFHDPYAAMSPSYSRGLQYHALHDVSQYLIDNPLVHAPDIGCTTVVAKGDRAIDHHLLVGRLFDFEGGSCFDRDKIVYTVKPEGGIPFVSVSWGGMAGAVTGMNEAGIWVSINSAATDGQTFVGRPIVMVVRQILETCRTIDEAIKLVEAAPVFVSDSVLLASAKEGRVVSVEKGPRACGLREMNEDTMVVTNHFLSSAWDGDQSNAARIQNGTTVKRSERAKVLLNKRRWHHAGSLIEVLRDRRGVDDADVGFGNRSTINAWIGAHLVVADITDGVMWVAEPYHGLGQAFAFDVNGPAQRDPLPTGEEWELHKKVGDAYNEAEKEVQRLLVQRDMDKARIAADNMIALNPQSFRAHELRAVCASDAAERIKYLEKALTLQPAYPKDEQAIKDALAAAQAELAEQPKQ